MRPGVWAHRGASAHEPENTLEAFRAAVAFGADGIELDVRFDGSGGLVVHHDPTFVDGRVIAEVVTADHPVGLCHLADALEACGALEVNVEVKVEAPGEGLALAGPVLEVVEAWGGRTVLSSFDPDTVDELRRLAPHLPTAQLTLFPDRDLADLVRWVADRGHGAWNPHHLLVTEASAELARDAGVRLVPWTVDDPDRIRALAALGVDAIITNDVPGARAALEGAGAGEPAEGQ